MTPVGYNAPFQVYRFGPIEVDIDSLTPLKGKCKRIYAKVKASIKKDGLFNPINIDWHLVEGKADKLFVAVGNNRWHACKELGWKKIPCYVRAGAYKIGKYPDGSNVMEEVCKTLKLLL